MTIARTIGRGAIGSPLEIPGCQLWLDAADASTITASSGAVSQWNDKSGNGFNVAQSEAAKKPTTGAATQNGRNVISFSSSVLFSGSVALLKNVDGFSMLVVAQPPSGTNSPLVVVSDGVTASTQRGLMYIGQSAGANRQTAFGMRLDGGTGTGVEGSTNLGTSWRMLASVGSYAATTMTAWIDGVQEGQNTSWQTSGYTSNTDSKGIFVGAWNNLLPPSSAYGGKIAEIIIYGSALPAATRIRIETYLRSKWGTG